MDNLAPRGPWDIDNAPAMTLTLSGIIDGDIVAPAIVDNAAIVSIAVLIIVVSLLSISLTCF